MWLVASCGHKWERKLAPCPEGRQGCLVAHYGDFETDRYCPECGHDIKKDFTGKPLTIKEEIGVAVINPHGVSKLKLYE